MQTLSEIKRMLSERGLVPRHRFGQNFLHDHNLIRKLVASSGVTAGDLVLEIGPGTGALTEALLEAGASVIACEIDRDLAAIIRERFGETIALIEGDCMPGGRRFSSEVLAALGDRSFALVANLPYNVASPIMAGLLVDDHACLGQYVTIQREVADRLRAEPGTKAFGPLTVIIRALAQVERIATLGPGCFWPPPKVDSAMIAIRPHDDHHIDDKPAFARFVTELFTKRRKQLGSSLGRDIEWPEGVTADRRPDSLTIAQIVALWRVCSDRT